MKRCRLLALIALTGLSLQSRSQSIVDNPLYRHLPADAEKVYEINYTSLSSKFDWKTLAAVLPKKQENEAMIAALINPAMLGIDAGKGIFIAESNTLGPDSPRYTTFLIPLTDSGKLIRALMDRGQHMKFATAPGKVRTAWEGAKTTYAWNDKLMVMTIVKAPIVQNGKPAISNPGAPPDNRYIQRAIRKSIAALKGFEKSPFVTDPFFREGFSGDADLHTWSRFGGGFGMMTTLMQMTHASLDKSFTDAAQGLKKSNARSVGALRFDNGRILFRSLTTVDSTLRLDPGVRPLNTSLIERLPQGNLLGIATVHFDPSAWLNILQNANQGKTIHSLDSLMAKTGLTVKDLLSAFKGDLLLALIDDGKTIPATDSTPVKPGKPNLFFVLTIDDKTAFEKLEKVLYPKRDSASANRSNAGDSSNAAGRSPKPHTAHALREDIFIAGPSQQAIDDYFNKPGRGPSSLVTDDVRSYPAAIVVDMQALKGYLQPTFNSASAKDKQAQILFDLFDRIAFVSGKTRNNTMETQFEIKMTDQQQNSLTVISQLITRLGKK